MDIRELTLEEWDGLLPDTGGEVFHATEALGVIDEYAGASLRLFGGFRGQQPVALYPVFVRELWGVQIVVSPPPGLSVPRLGPMLMPTSPKARKQEKLNRRFNEGVLDALDVDRSRTLFGMVGSREYTDPRPYWWAGYSVVPRFGYSIDLTDRSEDDVLASFTRGLRREIGKREEVDIDISVEGPAQAERICRAVESRFVEQGITYPTPPSFARDLVDALGDRARVYVARDSDGEFLSGITVLYSDDEALFWEGGIKANHDGVSVNSLLHWAIISDILGESSLAGVERYDLGNVNHLGIAQYKGKFNADLVTSYEIRSLPMVVAKKAYSIRRHLTVNRLRSLFSQ